MGWPVKFNQRGHLPSNSLSSYLACMKRTLSTWHVHHAHTAPDLPAAQTVDYIGDRSKGPYWRWGSLPGRTRLLLLQPVCCRPYRGAYFGRRNSSSSAAGYIERAVVWTRTQRVHDRVDMTALADQSCRISGISLISLGRWYISVLVSASHSLNHSSCEACHASITRWLDCLSRSFCVFFLPLSTAASRLQIRR